MTGSPARTIAYGPHPDQVGELYESARAGSTLLCLLHGGFWRMPYDRHELEPIARDLHGRGYSVWNVEYRRVGIPGGGWPTPGADVMAAIDHVRELDREGPTRRWSSIALIGHSAGGHLALWAAAESARLGLVSSDLPLVAVVGLAPITDLLAAFEARLGAGAVAGLLGGSPAECPQEYRTASPRARLPIDVPILLIHGTADDAVPIGQSRAFVDAARIAGDQAELLEVAGADHMAHIDPASESHAALCDWLLRSAIRTR